MKKFLGGVALSVFLAAPAMAADLPARMPVKAPEVFAPMYNWSGFYIGGHVGYGSGDSEWGLVGGTISASRDISGLVGGLHTGVNWQSGSFVFGLEGAVGVFGKEASVLCPTSTSTCFTEVDHFWRAGARAGFATGATGNWLIYGTGGFARANLNTHLVTVGGTTINPDDQHHHGWYGGGGIEWGVSQNFVLGVEAYYVTLGNEIHGPLGAQRELDLNFAVVQARASWKFGGWGR